MRKYSILCLTVVLFVFFLSSCAFLQDLVQNKYNTITIIYGGETISVKTPPEWPDFQNLDKDLYETDNVNFLGVFQVFGWSLKEKPYDWYTVGVLRDSILPVLMAAKIDGRKYYYIVVEGLPIEVDVSKWNKQLNFFYKNVNIKS